MFITRRIFREEELKNFLLNIGNTPAGAEILSKKGNVYTFVIEEIDTRAANILKQDAIASGGDCALPREASSFKCTTCTAVLIVSLRSLEKLLERLKKQPFGLKFLGKEIEKLVAAERKSQFEFDVNGKKLVLDKPVIMGILNVTPDSFSDGGKWNSVDKALFRVEEMIEEGAEIIDVGGESTRPGSEPVPIDEEKRRVVPIIDAIRRRFPEIFISVDTYKSEVAKEALDAGADIVNDISGFHFDEKMAGLVAERGVPAVLMHIKGTPKNMQKNPYYKDVVKEICEYFEKTVDSAVAKGVKREQIILDPGIGFGKRVEDNLEILKRINEFKRFGLPLLLGTSRKSFIGFITGEKDPENRVAGSLASIVRGVLNGVKIVRVHDVKETRQFIDILFAVEEA
ncbi:dihydropteroate synthase [Desulfurobacterium atlanticum]|uniref:Dihydropteroate synthase n=1 Tax=Desulfurobacterium atlanticum TaxID=240169 RepID=A0A238Y7C6_9BACT|nr:dihydropteroate synthase [Desulfurobacterium atlanticum]SNR66728.1 dihydropteroate synthase [Desulfurobacterium atlanticum]